MALNVAVIAGFGYTARLNLPEADIGDRPQRVKRAHWLPAAHDGLGSATLRHSTIENHRPTAAFGALDLAVAARSKMADHTERD
jgi:hypothetical protein